VWSAISRLKSRMIHPAISYHSACIELSSKKHDSTAGTLTHAAALRRDHHCTKHILRCLESHWNLALLLLRATPTHCYNHPEARPQCHPHHHTAPSSWTTHKFSWHHHWPPYTQHAPISLKLHGGPEQVSNVTWVSQWAYKADPEIVDCRLGSDIKGQRAGTQCHALDHTGTSMPRPHRLLQNPNMCMLVACLLPH